MPRHAIHCGDGGISCGIFFVPLQECATVPANPFPEPTNGKAMAMWKQVHNKLLPATTAATGSPLSDSNSNGHGFQHATKAPAAAAGGAVGEWGSPAMTGVVEAVMTAAAAFKAGGEGGDNGDAASAASGSPASSARLCKKARPESEAPSTCPSLSNSAERSGEAMRPPPPVCGGSGSAGPIDKGVASEGATDSCRGRSTTSDEGPLCQEQQRLQRDISPEPKSSKPVLLGDTRGAGGDGNDSSSSSKGMRQESYYLRGVIEADRDKKLVATIASCLPGTNIPLMADLHSGFALASFRIDSVFVLYCVCRILPQKFKYVPKTAQRVNTAHCSVFLKWKCLVVCSSIP